MLIDTHAHLYLEHFDADRDAVVLRALDAGVKKILLPNIDNSTVEAMVAMGQKFPDNCYPMIGLHPCSVGANYRKHLQHIESRIGDHDFVAIGEIGTDHYWDVTYREEQEGCFRHQISLAKEVGIPVVIHSRETLDLNIRIISEMQDGSLFGVFHCFTGSLEQAQQIADLGFYMGIGGVLTFRNAGLDKVISNVALNYLILETDAPYLTPHPYRGKRNESSYVPLIADKLAEVMGLSREEIDRVTTANALRLFGRVQGE